MTSILVTEYAKSMPKVAGTEIWKWGDSFCDDRDLQRQLSDVSTASRKTWVLYSRLHDTIRHPGNGLATWAKLEFLNEKAQNHFCDSFEMVSGRRISIGVRLPTYSFQAVRI